MDTWDAITSRRNVRDYDDRPVPSEDLDRVLEAGRRAPSSRNWQPWDFILVTGRERLTELAKVWQYAQHVARSQATIVLLGVKTQTAQERDWMQFDLGQATMAMMIAAADLGLGTGHAAIGDHELAQRLLGFPDDREAIALMAIGYPADRPLAPLKKINRRPFDEVVHRDRW